MRTFKKLFNKNNVLVFVFVFILFSLVFFMYKKNYEGFAKLHVGNLPYNYTMDELRQSFSQYGDVIYANVVKPQGLKPSEFTHGFVEASSDEQAQIMVDALNGTMIGGRSITVALSDQIKSNKPTKAPPKAPPKAPTKAPPKAPTKAPAKAPAKAVRPVVPVKYAKKPLLEENPY